MAEFKINKRGDITIICSTTEEAIEGYSKILSTNKPSDSPISLTQLFCMFNFPLNTKYTKEFPFCYWTIMDFVYAYVTKDKNGHGVIHLPKCRFFRGDNYE